MVAPDGGVLLIESYYGPVASLAFKRMFASEDFDKTMPGWTTDTTGPMHGANQALSYIVFARDRVRFEPVLRALEAILTPARRMLACTTSSCSAAAHHPQKASVRSSADRQPVPCQR